MPLATTGDRDVNSAMKPPHPQGAIYYVVGDRETSRWGFGWRIWWGRTSFYMKPMTKSLAQLKVSLHGDDPVIQNPMLKLDIDRNAAQAVEKAGGAHVSYTGLPLIFPGVTVSDRPEARLVARIRSAWDMFQDQSVSAEVPKEPKASRNLGALSEAPPMGFATDLDIFISTGEPYWPNEAQAMLDNAAVGPLRNEAGECLTAVVVRRFTSKTPTPGNATQPSGPTPEHPKKVRGIGAACDEDGLLWLVEQHLHVP